MNKLFKIILLIASLAILVGFCQFFYERHSLQLEYSRTLEQKEDEYIKLFYHSTFNGIITYIKQYEKNPDKYVVSVKDLTNNERTIGKVEITNFSHVVEGDSVIKKLNSFELLIVGAKGKTISVVKYE